MNNYIISVKINTIYTDECTPYCENDNYVVDSIIIFILMLKVYDRLEVTLQEVGESCDNPMIPGTIKELENVSQKM